MVNDRLAPSSNGAPKPRLSDADQLLHEFQRIEQIWGKAEEKLSATRVPVDVRVKVGSVEDCVTEDTTYLAYAKVKGVRRICVVREDHSLLTGEMQNYDSRPVVECPVDVRIEMFDHFEMLYAEAKAVAKSYISKLQGAINKFDATLELIDM